MDVNKTINIIIILSLNSLVSFVTLFLIIYWILEMNAEGCNKDGLISSANLFFVLFTIFPQVSNSKGSFLISFVGVGFDIIGIGFLGIDLDITPMYFPHDFFITLIVGKNVFINNAFIVLDINLFAPVVFDIINFIGKL